MTHGAVGAPVLLQEVQISAREHLRCRPELGVVKLLPVIERCDLRAGAGVGDADGALRVRVGHRLEGRGAAAEGKQVRTTTRAHHSANKEGAARLGKA